MTLSINCMFAFPSGLRPWALAQILPMKVTGPVSKWQLKRCSEMGSAKMQFWKVMFTAPTESTLLYAANSNEQWSMMTLEVFPRLTALVCEFTELDPG